LVTCRNPGGVPLKGTAKIGLVEGVVKLEERTRLPCGPKIQPVDAIFAFCRDQ